MQKNDLKRKLRLIVEFLASQTGQQIFTMHILTNISKSNGNQAMGTRKIENPDSPLCS